METVAACNDIALEHLLLALVPVPNRRPLGLQVVEADIRDGVEERAAGGTARRDQILDDPVLAVDRDRAPAGQLAQRDPVAPAEEAQLDPVVDEPFALDARGEPDVTEHVHHALLEHACAHTRDHVLLRSVFEHDRLHPRAVEEVGEQ